MIGLPRSATVYAFDEPCDMRKSFDALTALVTERMRRQVLTGSYSCSLAAIGAGRRSSTFDGTGMCLFSKTLAKGLFSAAWERARSTSGYEMTLTDLALFVEGREGASRLPLSRSLPSKADLVRNFAAQSPVGH